MSVQTEPAEQAFLDLIGRPEGARGDADIAAAVKVLRFLVKASIMGSSADLDVLRGWAAELDSDHVRRASVVRCIVRGAKPFAEWPGPTERAVKEGFERFPVAEPDDRLAAERGRPLGPAPAPELAATRAIDRLYFWIARGEELAKEDPSVNDGLQAMRRIVAVYELREDLTAIDARFGRLDPATLYDELASATGRKKGGRGNVGLPGLAGRLSASVGAFGDTEKSVAAQAFRDAQLRLRGRRC
ncbi:hypothetical protein [Sorangium sp. So ce145]|uniref:hypothetical protein n=1 Tax=Sorangium sp. So ce145 TaxID=3133285 RepID=UPI003F63396E